MLNNTREILDLHTLVPDAPIGKYYLTYCQIDIVETCTNYGIRADLPGSEHVYFTTNFLQDALKWKWLYLMFR